MKATRILVLSFIFAPRSAAFLSAIQVDQCLAPLQSSGASVPSIETSLDEETFLLQMEGEIYQLEDRNNNNERFDVYQAATLRCQLLATESIARRKQREQDELENPKPPTRWMASQDPQIALSGFAACLAVGLLIESPALGLANMIRPTSNLDISLTLANMRVRIQQQQTLWATDLSEVSTLAHHAVAQLRQGIGNVAGSISNSLLQAQAHIDSMDMSSVSEKLVEVLPEAPDMTAFTSMVFSSLDQTSAAFSSSLMQSQASLQDFETSLLEEVRELSSMSFSIPSNLLEQASVDADKVSAAFSSSMTQSQASLQEFETSFLDHLREYSNLSEEMPSKLLEQVYLKADKASAAFSSSMTQSQASLQDFETTFLQQMHEVSSFSDALQNKLVEQASFHAERASSAFSSSLTDAQASLRDIAVPSHLENFPGAFTSKMSQVQNALHKIDTLNMKDDFSKGVEDVVKAFHGQN